MIGQQSENFRRPWPEGRGHDKEPAKRFVVEERRRHERITIPNLAVTLDGGTYTAVSWSLGGFEVEGYDGKLTPGALFSIQAVGKVGGEMTKVSVRARVVRSDSARRSLVVSFFGLDGRAYKLLHEVMSERMRLLKERTTG